MQVGLTLEITLEIPDLIHANMKTIEMFVFLQLLPIVLN